MDAHVVNAVVCLFAALPFLFIVIALDLAK